MSPALLLAFLRRDLAIARSYRLPFLLQLVGTLIAMVVLFEVGKLVDRGVQPTGEGLGKGFFPFVLVGIAVLQLSRSGLGSFAAKLREEQTTGTFEALLATPAPTSAVILASAAYALLQAVLSSVVLLIVGVGLGLRLSLRPAAVLTTLVDTLGLLALFAALGVVVAAFGVVVKRGNALVGLLTSGLALLGGAYFPIDLLPRPLALLGQALPFTWGLTALRQSLLFGHVDVLRSVGLVAVAAALLPLALWVFAGAVDRARRDGSLTQY